MCTVFGGVVKLLHVIRDDQGHNSEYWQDTYCIPLAVDGNITHRRLGAILVASDGNVAGCAQTASARRRLGGGGGMSLEEKFGYNKWEFTAALVNQKQPSVLLVVILRDSSCTFKRDLYERITV